MELSIGEQILKVNIIKKARKTISIKINENGEVIVSAPLFISNKRLQQLIKSKEGWIISKLKHIKESKEEGFSLERGVSYLGVNYPISIFHTEGNSIRIAFNKSSFNIYVPYGVSDEDEIIKAALIKWYREEARGILEKRTNLYAEILGVYPKKIFIKDQKTRWGSCSSKGNINLNYRIIMAPLDIVDYLVVHELCHLVHLDHSKEFWKLASNILPDYRKSRNWLKLNGGRLKF